MTDHHDHEVPFVPRDQPCPDYPHTHYDPSSSIVSLADEPMFSLGSFTVLYQARHPDGCPCDESDAHSPDFQPGICLDVQLLTEHDVENPLRIYIEMSVPHAMLLIRELAGSGMEALTGDMDG